MNSIIKNKKKSEVLVEAISALQYGDIIKHDAIAELIETPYKSAKYNSIITQAKKKLLKEHGIVIENIRGDGYRLINPDDFTQASLRHYKRGFREMQKGSDTLEYAPVKNMTQEGRDTYRRVYDRSVTLQAALNGAKVELKTLGEKRHPFLAAIK